jgi:hypothetical protein
LGLSGSTTTHPTNGSLDIGAVTGWTYIVPIDSSRVIRAAHDLGQPGDYEVL